MNGTAGYFGKIGKREKFLFATLAVVVLGVIVFRAFVGPYFSEKSKFSKNLQKILDDKAKVVAKYPDVKGQEKENAELSDEYDSVVKEVAEQESKLPSAASVSQLLGEITRCAEGLSIDFESINQDIERDKEGYLKLKLDVRFSGPYSSAVNYLNRLQDISEYLTVSNIEISQSKEGAQRSKTKFELSMILVEKGINLTFGEKERSPVPLVIKNDPFASKKADKKKATQFKLAGVTGTGKGATAIINNEVVGVGSKIGEWEVIEISPDGVTLSDGTETVSLTINR